MTSFTGITLPRRKVLIGAKNGDSKAVLLELEASVSEGHTSEAQVTEHPVENGSNITDHIRRQPLMLEIEGVISNKPITSGSLAGLGIQGGEVKNRATDAYAEMQRWQDEGIVLFVSTTLREYENLVLTGLSVTRNARNGDILRANMSFREIITTSTERGAVPEPVEINDRRKADKGPQPKKQSKEEVKKGVKREESLAVRGINWLFGS